MSRYFLLLLAFLTTLGGSVSGQSFQIVPTQVEIAVAPEFNHAGIAVPITGTAAGFNFAGLSVTSDASWVTGTVNAATGEVALSFQTASLISSSTASITVSGNGTTDSFFVKATIAPLDLVKLEDDPLRSRTYGVHQNGINAGALVIIDPLTNTKLACVTVGKKPADIAISRDGTEALVINCVDESVTAIDLASMKVKATIALPQFDNWGVNDTTADVAYGPGNIIYYTDGAWAPALRVFDRSTRLVTQTVLDDTYGFGDFALAPDGQSLFAWVQYGWTAGFGGSYVLKYSVDAQGKLTFSQRTSSTYPTALSRDPIDTPVLIGADGQLAYIKQLAVSTTSITETPRSFPKPVYSLSPGGEIAVTDSAVYQTSTGINLLDLPTSTPVQAITSDYARLVYFNKTSRTIGTIDLLAAVGATVLNRNLSPADGSITLAPQKLEWSAVPGVDRYRVYLGESQAEVQAAGTTSASYLGEVNTPAIQLTRTLTPGTTYYWRVDAVTQSEVVKGTIYSFTVSLIGTDRTSIQTATVQGHSAHKVSIQLSSTSPQNWSATATQPWVTFENTTGATPSTLNVVLDASKLQKGVHTAQISIALTAGGQTAFTIPVSLEVEPLAITVMESDRTSGLVYAISEDKTQGGTSRAYLLEIDTVAKALKRVVRVGTSATDLAVHNADGRVYVTNWAIGSLLALDKTTLQQVRAYGFSAFQGTGYGNNDVYRIAAGSKGRLLVEEQDQWVDILIFDTEAGTKLSSVGLREGGGEFGPGGRYYYHGENNSSGAEVLKYDVIGDVFTKLANIRVESASYYGSRTVVVSENGERVFWNGGVLDENLVVEWLIGKEIFSTTPDGKFAFGEESIYDVDRKQAVLAMPVKTRVSAFNSTSNRLVVQNGTQVAFFNVNDPVGFTAPVLSTGTVTTGSVLLTWTDDSLETGFTLQRRVAGASTWEDVAASLGANVTTYTVAGLTAATTYEFRIKADSSAYSSDWSAIASATTLTAPLSFALTTAASNISASGATLNGNANPNGISTTAYFEYGLTSSFGSSTTSSALGTGTSSINVARTLTNLQPGTTYHYRLVAVNSAGTVWGNGMTFTTAVAKPVATTDSATNVDTSSATLSGSINPNGSATTARFDYGLTPGFGNMTDEIPIGSDNGLRTSSLIVEGLQPGRVYYYRVAATNAGGTTYGITKSFATLNGTAAPSVLTGAATNVTDSSAVLNGTVSSNGLGTSAWFEYGTSNSYGQTTAESAVDAGAGTEAVSFLVTGISNSQAIHFRVVARNEKGTTYGMDRVFTTTGSTLETVDDEAFTTALQPVVIDILANDSGIPAEALVTVGSPSVGSAHVNANRSVTYTPSSAFKELDTFTYRVSNGAGQESLATVIIRASFPAAAGTYNGLVGSKGSQFNSAGVITIKATPAGSFTGVLKFAGETHRLKGKLRYDGEASVELAESDGASLLMSFKIDQKAKRLTGSVATQAGAVPLEAAKAPFDAFHNAAPQAGRYTVLLTSGADAVGAQGHGFATMKVTTSGAVALTGRSPLGEPFTSSAFIGSDLRFPLYAVAESAAATSLQGWVEFRNVAGVSDCDGAIGHSKGVSAPVMLSLVGSRYLVPMTGRLLLPWQEGADNGVLSFGSATLANSPSFVFVSLDSNHKVSAPAGAAVSMKINAETGAFSGKFRKSEKDKPAVFRGVIFQRQSMGAGVLGTKQSQGWVTFEDAQTQSPHTDQ